MTPVPRAVESAIQTAEVRCTSALEAAEARPEVDLSWCWRGAEMAQAVGASDVASTFLVRLCSRGVVVACPLPEWSSVDVPALRAVVRLPPGLEPGPARAGWTFGTRGPGALLSARHRCPDGVTACEALAETGPPLTDGYTWGEPSTLQPSLARVVWRADLVRAFTGQAADGTWAALLQLYRRDDPRLDLEVLVTGLVEPPDSGWSQDVFRAILPERPAASVWADLPQPAPKAPAEWDR